MHASNFKTIKDQKTAMHTIEINKLNTIIHTAKIPHIQYINLIKDIK